MGGAHEGMHFSQSKNEPLFNYLKEFWINPFEKDLKSSDKNE